MTCLNPRCDLTPDTERSRITGFCGPCWDTLSGKMLVVFRRAALLQVKIDGEYAARELKLMEGTE